APLAIGDLHALLGCEERERELIIEAVPDNRDFVTPGQRLYRLVAGKRDQHTKDDDCDFLAEAAPVADPSRCVDLHVPPYRGFAHMLPGPDSGDNRLFCVERGKSVTRVSRVR